MNSRTLSPVTYPSTPPAIANQGSSFCQVTVTPLAQVGVAGSDARVPHCRSEGHR